MVKPAQGPGSRLTSGWSLRKSTGSSPYLLVPGLSAGLARRQGPEGSPRAARLPGSASPAAAAPVAGQASPCARRASSAGNAAAGPARCRGAGARQLRVRSTSGSQFSQTYGHMGKRTTCYLTALLDFASVYFQPSVVAPREFCTVHIFPQYGAKIIHFTLQRS